MGNTFILKMDVLVSRSITQAAEDAKRIARLLDIWIEFDFNGVRCSVLPDTKVETVVSQYHKKLGERK